MSETPLDPPEAPPPFPGAAPSVSGTPARSLVVGRFATASVKVGAGSDLIVVNLFDWEVSANFDFADATAHGDLWKVKVFLDGDWTARGRGYVTGLQTTQYIKSATASGIPTALTFSGWGDMGQTWLLWAGPCFINRGRISAPMAMMEQEFEFISSGVPTAGLG